jgi:intracellular sulfur oxidation DsrE/DsrF family protein
MLLKESFMRSLKILTAALCLAVPAGAAVAQDAAPLVTIVTAEHPQTQLMAMVLTSQAAQQGHPVRVLLCGPGGDMALADAPEGVTAPQPPMGASPQGLLAQLLENGATVEVCAIYLPGLGADASVLMDGVTVAQPPAMAAAMAAEGSIVWSF